MPGTVARVFRRLLACTLTVLLGAGCGGGSGGSNSAPAQAVPAAAPRRTSGPATNATLSIRYPSGFHQLKLAATGRKAEGGAARTPAFVNPTSGDLIHIYVSGREIGGSPFAVAATADGTQTATVPVYASEAGATIAVTETDATNVTTLASGTGLVPALSAGSSPALTVSMVMVATNMGLTTDPTNGSDAVALPAQFCASTSTVYPFAADGAGGFVIPAAVGAGAASGTDADGNPIVLIPTPSLTSQSSANGGSSHVAQGLVGGYRVFFDSNFDPIVTGWAVVNGSTVAPGTNSFRAVLYPACSLAVSANATSLTTGSTATLTVGKGVLPYTFTTSTPSVCSVTPLTATTATIAALAGGSCSVSATDVNNYPGPSATIVVSAPLTMTCNTGCSTSAVSDTITLSESGNAYGSFTVSTTGTGCFSASSASADSTGTAALLVTGSPLGGTCNISVQDSHGQTNAGYVTFTNAAASPTTTTVNAGNYATPSGLNSFAVTSPATHTAFPVIVWGGYTFLPFTFSSNPGGDNALTAFDANGALVTTFTSSGCASNGGSDCIDTPGMRYIASITIGATYATLYGQSGSATVYYSTSDGTPSLMQALPP